MIKKNDGYILLYVMVVVMTLCILAASICASAVRNLKVQQHSVDHMKFVYEAEGVGERFVAELQKAVRFEKEMTLDEHGELVPEVKLYSLQKTDGGQEDLKHREAAEVILTDAVKTAMVHALADPALVEDKIVLIDPSGNEVLEADVQSTDLSVGNYDEDTHKVHAELEFLTVSGDSSLDSKIKVSMTMVMDEIEATEAGDSARYEYSVAEVSFEYLSYVIGSVNPEADLSAEEGGGI